MQGRFGERSAGCLGCGHPRSDVVDHRTQALDVLGHVAASGTRLSPRRAEAVASFPGPQGRGRDAQFVGDGGDRATAIGLRGLRENRPRHVPSPFCSCWYDFDCCVFSTQSPQEEPRDLPLSYSRSCSYFVQHLQHTFFSIFTDIFPHSENWLILQERCLNNYRTSVYPCQHRVPKMSARQT